MVQGPRATLMYILLSFDFRERCRVCAKLYVTNFFKPGTYIRLDVPVIRKHRRIDLPGRPVCAGSRQPPAGRKAEKEAA